MEKNEPSREQYNSVYDTDLHIANIQTVIETILLPEIIMRSKNHDTSKLYPPEKACYDKYIPKLRTAKYGTPEYLKIREEMQKDGLDHHYQVNRHHPEHFKNGVNDMNLIDLFEMICDWFAASLVSDTTFIEGLDSNIKKFEIPEMMANIIKNTYEDYFKRYERAYKTRTEDKENVSTIRDMKLNLYETEKDGYISRQQLTTSIYKLDRVLEKG